jgi:hypothetical protein
MAITSVRCPVLAAHVTQVADLEGNVTRVICAEYSSDGSCRLKKSTLKGGPLSQLLARVSEDALSTKSTRCVLIGPP